MPQRQIASDLDEVIALFTSEGWVVESYHHDLSAGCAWPANWKRGCGMRFTDIPVPASATIFDAFLTFRCWASSDQDVVRSYIRGELNANPAQFSDEADYFGRARTTAKKDWSNIPHWQAGENYRSPSFPAVIQEIVNLPGWSQGKPLVLFWDDHDDRSDHDFNTRRMANSHYHNPSTAPILNIYYKLDQNYECYTIGGDTYYPLDVHKAAAQTFVPQEQFEVHWVDLQLKTWLASARPWVHIYQCGAPAHPVGDPLSYSIAEDSRLIWPGTSGRVRFKMTPYVLEPETMYILVVRQSTTFFEPPDEWQYDAGDATYPRGYRVAQEGTDEPWDTHLNDDHIFAIFGSPPAPPPPPEPPIRNWAILNIEQAITATGYKIAVITNVPCHLYMMWTNHEPNKHKIVGLRRGDLALRETRYCFVDWHKNEQEEAGDTLTHTFIKEPWPVCETRWFTFKGDVDTLWTASAGPIFKKHRVAPPTTQDFYPDPRPGVSSFDGFSLAGRTYLTWAQLNARPARSWIDSGSRMYVTVISTSVSDKWWEVDRSIALFDTSIIAPGSTILSATLKLFLGCPYCQIPGFAINIYSSDPLLNTTISQEDHLSLGAIPFSTNFDLEEWFNDKWVEFPFKAAGLAAIVPGGITKLGIREANFDAPNIAPPWPGSGQTYVAIMQSDYGPYWYPPTLTVTWKP